MALFWDLHALPCAYVESLEISLGKPYLDRSRFIYDAKVSLFESFTVN